MKYHFIPTRILINNKKKKVEGVTNIGMDLKKSEPHTLPVGI